MDTVKVSIFSTCQVWSILHHFYFYLGGGRRRGNSKTDNGTGVLNRGNTIVAPGYGGMRHYLNQIPYVTPPSQSEYVEWFSR